MTPVREQLVWRLMGVIANGYLHLRSLHWALVEVSP
jgi:hypothetical protein